MNNQICTYSGGNASVSARSPSAAHGHGKSLRSILEGGLIRVFDIVLSWRENARSRRALAGLSDQMLSDIGISRAAAEREFSLPFWR